MGQKNKRKGNSISIYSAKHLTIKRQQIHQQSLHVHSVQIQASQHRQTKGILPLESPFGNLPPHFKYLCQPLAVQCGLRMKAVHSIPSPLGSFISAQHAKTCSYVNWHQRCPIPQVLPFLG